MAKNRRDLETGKDIPEGESLADREFTDDEMTPENFDATEIFETQIRPLLDQIREICLANKIPHMVLLDVKQSDEGYNLTSMMANFPHRAPDKLQDIFQIIDADWAVCPKEMLRMAHALYHAVPMMIGRPDVMGSLEPEPSEDPWEGESFQDQIGVEGWENEQPDSE